MLKVYRDAENAKSFRNIAIIMVEYSKGYHHVCKTINLKAGKYPN